MTTPTLSPREAVAGIQAQDAHAAEAGVWVRHPALTLGNFAQAWADGRSVVRTWAMRGTLNLLTTADVGWMLPLHSVPLQRWLLGAPYGRSRPHPARRSTTDWREGGTPAFGVKLETPGAAQSC